MILCNMENQVQIEFRFPEDIREDLEYWECRFAYTEINLLNEHCTDEIRLNLKKAGYKVEYEKINNNITTIGVKNPMKYFGFVELVPFYFDLKENSDEILKEIRECISAPFTLKLIVKRVKNLFLGNSNNDTEEDI